GAKGIQREGPEPVDIVVRIKSTPENRVRSSRHGDFGAGRAVQDHDLGIGLADVENGDAAVIRRHGIWKTVTRSLWTGELSGLVAMMSAMCAHHFLMTGWSGRLAIVWSAGRVSTPNSVFVSRS